MADEFSPIERLLGLPEGSTKNIDPSKAGEKLVKGVANKTNQLNKDLKKTETLEKMSNADLVKSGISIESLEKDKDTIRNEAFEVYRIAKSLLIKYQDDVDDRIDVDDRMYTAGAKLVDSVTGSLDKLTNMILRFKQEEDMKNLTLVGETEEGKKEMSPQGWIDFVDEVKDDEEDLDNIQDAEIIEDSGNEE